MGDEYDYARLTAALGGVKKAFPRESKAILAAAANVPYWVLARTMDACREGLAVQVEGKPALLFFDVSLAAGFQSQHAVWDSDRYIVSARSPIPGAPAIRSPGRRPRPQENSPVTPTFAKPTVVQLSLS